MANCRWNNRSVKCVSLPTRCRVELAQLDISSRWGLPKPLSHPWYCYVLTTVTLFCQEYPNSSPTKLQKLRGLKLFCQTHFKTSKRAYAPPVLAKLHWLPMVQRTEYKLSSMCCDAVSKTALPYMSDLLHRYIPSRSLRSSADTRTFRIPKQNVPWATHFFPSGPCHMEWTLYSMLQQNPSSRLSSKLCYSSQPMDQALGCLKYFL